jgi:DNA excision repair protein ERCC-2
MPREKKSDSNLPMVRVSVRELVEFVLRTGGLGRESVFVGPRRALEGAKAHQRIQKSRPADYEAEVFLTREITTATLTLRISGRIDGLIRSLDQWHIEEIKTLSRPHDGEPDPLHWAQAKIYGAMLATNEPNAPGVFEFQLTYLELATGKISQHRQTATRAELEQFFQQVVVEYLRWAEAQAAWERTRNESISTLEFPFASYRTGQRALAVAVYRTIRDGEQLIAEAPTGIGKTVSVLFPAIKALGEGKVRKIFYLTARTIGRAVAQETVALLRGKGLRLRSLTLTARDKICFKEAESCDALECPYATAYYDRIKPALRAALKDEALDRGAIEAVARRHSVCPFELSLDVARWADLIICDYNYAFDPGSYLRRFFDDDPGGYVFLVDEAHNLPERAREMFSAEFCTSELSTDIELIRNSAADAATTLQSLKESIESLTGNKVSSMPSAPEAVINSTKLFLASAEQQLVRNEAGQAHERLLQRYFEAARLLRTSENYDEGYATILTPAMDCATIRLFCADPTNSLKETLKRADASIFFSATLSPLQYFSEFLGGGKGPKQLQLPSPFPLENFSVIIHRKIETTLKQRANTPRRPLRTQSSKPVRGAPEITSSFFSSFQYLQDVFEKFVRSPRQL